MPDINAVIGYKVAVTQNREPVLVTLQIPGDAQSDMHRPGLVNLRMASYRANRVKVLSIKMQDGTEIEEAYSAQHMDPPFMYKVGEETVEPAYSEFNTCGIHFFRSLNRLRYYGRPIKNGTHKVFYENGRLRKKYELNNETLVEGTYKEWDEHGQLRQHPHIPGYIRREAMV